MLPTKSGLLVFCSALLLAATAAADGVGVTKYSFSSLDTFWRNQVASQPLASLTPALLRTSLGSTAPPLATKDGSGSGKTRSWTPPSQSTPRESLYFHVMPTDPRLDSELLSRQLSLGMFVNKTDYYEADAPPQVTENAGAATGPQVLAYEAAHAKSEEQTRLLELRKYSARLELFLISLVRYYAVETIPEKCARVKEAQELLAQIDAAKSGVNAILNRPAFLLSGPPLSLESRFVELQTLQAEVAQRTRAQIAEGKACIVTEVSTRKEDLASAAGQLEALLIKDLTMPSSDPSDPTKITMKDTIAAINAKQSELEAVKTSLNGLDPHANDLLELENKLHNAKSNFDMVQLDGLGARNAVNEMDTRVHVSEITNLSSVLANPAAAKRFDALGVLDDKLCGGTPCKQGSLFAALKTYLTALKEAPTKVPAVLQPPGFELDVCRTIDPDAFTNLSTTTADAAPIVACLDKLQAVMTRAAGGSALQQQMATFGQSVEQLSNLVLCQRQGIRLNTCPN